MTKVRITGLENIVPKIKLKIGKAISESGWHEDVKDEMIKEIRKNGMDKKLDKKIIEHRKYLAQYNQTHPDFSPSKSNLTLTGQLLDSLKGKFVTSKLMLIIDSSTRRHKKYKYGPKKRLSESGDFTQFVASKSKGTQSPSLKDIFQFQKDMGRDIAEVFKRSKFVDKIARKLQSAIKTFYRN